ncbi:phospholipase B1, membrane-associated [Salminus brasiliensis]|uniref:phospholipase B1, membrane-associated n=1 Tax=Salminus brasiliensis TaxID=930266 RepID=UPI003B83A352
MPVHFLRPGDVSMVSALGLSTGVHRSDASRTLSRLLEIMSTFNPAVTTLLPEQRSLLKEAEKLAISLNDNEWKLLLLFVPVDELCVCPGQASSAVDSAVHSVEEALDKLHEKLDHTLVHVVVWGGQVDAELHSGDGACSCQHEEDFSARTRNWHRLARAILMGALQESLGALLQRRGWWSDREDFSVVLQSSPTYIDSSLQPTQAKSGFPCPSQERPYLLTQRNSPSADLQPVPMMGTSLSCTHKSPSSSVPTSVHALRPADITVVGALGDSLTAGNGVGAAQNNLLDVLKEYRGLSWSVGGDSSLSSVTTLANILRQFNPSLTGFSTGEGKATTTQAFLNQAVAGAKSQDLVSQARALINRMKSDSRINFQNSWKVITVFIGGNDLCAYCTDTAYYSATNFANRIRDALDILHSEVPRAVVNLVEALYIIPLRPLHQDSSLGCPTWLINDICPCVVKPAEGSSELQSLININRAYQSSTRNLVNSGRYDTRSDFTVVLQPFMRDLVLPLLSNGKPDRSFFAPDCFHLSQKSQALMARSLWNNMLESISSKTASLNFQAGVTAKCPASSSSYITTSKNSRAVYQAVAAAPSPVTPSTEGGDSEPTGVSTTTSEVVLPLASDSRLDSVPSWTPALLAVAGLLIAVVATWLVMHHRKWRKTMRNQRPSSQEMKETPL